MKCTKVLNLAVVVSVDLCCRVQSAYTFNIPQAYRNAKLVMAQLYSDNSQFTGQFANYLTIRHYQANFFSLLK